jgi:hypothetical protein
LKAVLSLQRAAEYLYCERQRDAANLPTTATNNWSLIEKEEGEKEE